MTKISDFKTQNSSNTLKPDNIVKSCISELRNSLYNFKKRDIIGWIDCGNYLMGLYRISDPINKGISSRKHLLWGARESFYGHVYVYDIDEEPIFIYEYVADNAIASRKISDYRNDENIKGVNHNDFSNQFIQIRS